MKARILGMAAGLAALVGLAAAPADAAPITLNLTYSGFGGGSVADVEITFDDILLAPGTNIFGVLDGLDAFSMTITGAPGPTTFALSDLSGWVFVTGGSGGLGDILDINFFMEGNPPNADGFSIEGVDQFTFVLCDGDATEFGCFEDPLEVYQLGRAGGDAPEPATLALVGAGLAGLGLMRRRRRAA